MNLRHLTLLLLLALGGATASAACGSSSPSTFAPPPPDGGEPEPVEPPPTFVDAEPPPAEDPDTPPPRCNPCDDFPEAVLDSTSGAIPANVTELFGAPPSTSPTNANAALCITEPEPNAMLPRNWLRPRFLWKADGLELFEIRLKVQNQTHDLVVYTRAKEWKMDKARWDLLRNHSWDTDIVFTIRGVKLDGSSQIVSGGTMRVAPVTAPGSVVYWRILPDDRSELAGFRIGDESVVAALKPEQVQVNDAGKCVGCHTSTPDGLFVGVGTGGDNEHGNALASIEPVSAGAKPSWLGAGAAQLMADKKLSTAPAFSKAHWSNGDRHAIMNGPIDLTTSGSGKDDGAVHMYDVDLEAARVEDATRIVQRTGDANLPALPTWKQDGSTIAYVSTSDVHDGRINGDVADIFTVPYNGGQGGAAKGVPGASSADFAELYPGYSPDGKWLSFTRVAQGSWVGGAKFSNVNSEILVIPSEGGTPTRLSANDPAACTGLTSPGILNSWGRFSPEPKVFEGRTYYWIVFSSKRAFNTNQLYVTPVIVEADGRVTTHSALYLWNQVSTQSNHTPAWDVFKIAPVPPPR